MELEKIRYEKMLIENFYENESILVMNLEIEEDQNLNISLFVYRISVSHSILCD